jgi:hypothetical protein
LISETVKQVSRKVNQQSFSWKEAMKKYVIFFFFNSLNLFFHNLLG